MIDRFDGEYEWASNFHAHRIFYRGHWYDTSEHAYQCEKTLVPEERKMIRNASTPGKAKRLARKIALRPDWDEVKLGAMLEIVTIKFQDPELREKLLSTGDEELVEGNHWGDTFWGVCNGVGENWLGRILMFIRDEIRKG
jgi:ribA/ribD-fused uncharacterized protein